MQQRQTQIQIQIVQTYKASLLMQARQIQTKIQGLTCTFGFALCCYSSLDCFGLITLAGFAALLIALLSRLVILILLFVFVSCIS